MTIRVRAYNNGDHAALAWLPEDAAPIPDCRGFALKRSRGGAEQYLHSFVGFAQEDAFPTDAPWQWPLQRYLWWDYGVEPGDSVRYQVIPVTGADAGSLVERADLASDWTEALTITSDLTPHVSACFNKGVVASQWVSRELDVEAKGENRRMGLNEVIGKVGSPLRDALGGLLKLEVLKLLDEAAGGTLYAALYELNDPELIAGLKKLGAAANVILANGAFSAKSPDENKEVRDDLKQNSAVNVFDREVSTGHFAHNKFVVVCDADGVAQKVLTGSTNWSRSGLCSQANNGLVIDDHAVADRFLTQWNRLRDAGNGFPADLITENSQLEQFTVDGMTVTPWFAPTAKQADLAYARELIANAKQAALFLFFNPGIYQQDPLKQTLLQNILDRRDSGLYMRGVVNQEIEHLTKDPVAAAPAAVPVTLVGPAASTPLTEAVLVPANVKARFWNWEDEALGASLVMVHSKVVVLDPWGEHPVLMTGSHNLGLKASSKNDDNLVVLEGPAAAPLATAYAVNIIAIYQAYRWNAYVTQHAQDPKAWHGLEDSDAWQAGHLEGDSLGELRFWTQSVPATP